MKIEKKDSICDDREVELRRLSLVETGRMKHLGGSWQVGKHISTDLLFSFVSKLFDSVISLFCFTEACQPEPRERLPAAHGRGAQMTPLACRHLNGGWGSFRQPVPGA